MKRSMSKKRSIILFILVMVSFCCLNDCRTGRGKAYGSTYVTWKHRLDFPAQGSPFSMDFLNKRDIDAEGFVFVKGDHFFTRSGRIRFFGTNLTFDAAFPSHEEAEKIASQLSGLGLNIVRLTHLDMKDIWGKYAGSQEKFDEDQLEKLDYLLYQLKRRGIYVNLNLHVSRIYPNTSILNYGDLIKGDRKFRYGKGIDNVMPELIGMQKKYANALLTHTNKYTKLPYKADPCIALIEINNENSAYRYLFANRLMDVAPAYIREYLRHEWDVYLERKYRDMNELSKSWASDAKGLREFREIPLPKISSLSGRPEAYKLDFISFVHDLERTYWQTMIAYLKQDVGVKVPVTGTQLNYAFLDVSDLFDYVDIHGYWQSPVAGGRRRERSTNYYVENLSILPFEDNVFNRKLIPYRIKGKPYTVSEYNHAFPNEYGSEASIMAALVARMQDYDGIFYFNFLNKRDLSEVNFFNSYKSYVKKVLLPVSAFIFRTDYIHPYTPEYTLRLDKAVILRNALMGEETKNINPYDNKVPAAVYNRARVSLEIVSSLPGSIDGELEKLRRASFPSPDNLVWNMASPYKKSFLKFDSDYAKVYMGWKKDPNQYNFQGVTLSGVQSDNDYFSFSLFNKNGVIGGKGTYLLSILSKSRYSGMTFINYDNQSEVGLGDNYGIKLTARKTSGDTDELIELVKGDVEMRLQVVPKGVAVYTMDEYGKKGTAVKYTLKDGKLSFGLNRDAKGMVYVIEIE